MATTTGGTFVLNIVELQNTITSAGGLNPITSLTTAVGQLQEMVIFDEKRIAVNTISNYNQNPIQVVDPINFGSNVTLGGATLGSGSVNVSQISTIGYTSSFTNYYSTVGSGAAIEFQVGSPPLYPLSISGSGNMTITGGLKITGAGVPTIGHYLTCTDGVGTAQWLPPGFLSDSRWKTNIRPLDDYQNIMGGLRGVRFEWIGGKEDVGFIAQEVAAVMPEAVYEGSGDRPAMVEYQKIIPVLLEAIKGLEARVNHLEAIQHSK